MTGPEKSRQTLSATLIYPLQTECLLVILLFWVLICFFGLAFVAASLVPYIAPEDFMNLVVTSSLLCLFFEYGIDIIQTSQNGGVTPPALSYQTIKGQRFAVQVLFLTVIVAFAQYLHQQSFELAAFLLVFTYAVMWPAMMLSIASFDSLFEMINPVTLCGIAWESGWRYPLLTLFAAMIALATVAAYSVSLNTLLLATPFILYSLVLLFRWFGLSYKPAIVTTSQSSGATVDTALQSEARQALVSQLAHLYELKRSVGAKKVNKRILTMARFDNWSRFDPIFETISTWDDKRPALALVKEYLPQLMAANQPIKAFQLCIWSQLWDDAFCVDEIAIEQWLAEHAVTDEHKRSLTELRKVRGC